MWVGLIPMAYQERGRCWVCIQHWLRADAWQGSAASAALRCIRGERAVGAGSRAARRGRGKSHWHFSDDDVHS